MATTPKTKTAEPIVWDGTTPGEIDDALFDSWSEEDEEAAIAEAAAAVDVPCILIEGRIVAGRFPDRTVVKAPLTFSVADLDAVTAEHDNEVDQVKALLARMGGEQAVEQLNRQNLASVIIFASKFFEMFQRVATVALGKYANS